MKVVLVYDRVNKFGGAERILQVLHEIWPEAPLFTSVYDKQKTEWADGWDVRTSFLQKILLAKDHHQFLGWLMPNVFESMDLSEFDVIISLTSEAAKTVNTNKDQLHICYLLTPTRYLWSHTAEYLETIPIIFRPVALTTMSILRTRDYWAAQKPDKIISISQEVQKRCWKYYRRKSEIIYPGGGFSQNTDRYLVERELEIKDYYLVVSRLVPYKRIDLAVEAFNRLRKNLVIIGEGSNEKKLKSLAGPTIKFMGNLTDEWLVKYYRGARALVMPQEEDLGLTAIEAQSQGLPVIVYREGGAKELIVENKTGIVFYEQSVESLAKAIERAEGLDFKKEQCAANVKKYATEEFKIIFKNRIREIWNQK